METKRGILREFDSGTYKASVQLAGSVYGWVTGVRVARNIATAEMVAGRNVAVVMFDSSNPDDAVVAAVWT
jgi:hypothetical protein